MAWRVAKSLLTLQGQLNEKYPKRSKVSDGFIGNAAHQKVASDHNPNAENVVTAFDITHDPKHMDAHALAESIRKKPHPNCKYIISDSRIAGPFTTWLWGWYDGIDPHDTHIHISVGVGPDGKSRQPYDNETKWNIKEEAVSFIEPSEVEAHFNRAKVPFQPDKAAQLKYYSTHPGGYSRLYEDLMNVLIDRQDNNAAQKKLDEIKKIVS